MHVAAADASCARHVPTFRVSRRIRPPIGLPWPGRGDAGYPPAMIRVYLAHPYPDRSRANRVLSAAARRVDGVEVRSLYDLYPDFSIDVALEQRLLEEAEAIVWQHPIHWYTAPPLLLLWFEKVLTEGWAFGHEGRALEGKRCLWAVTTGGGEDAYTPAGIHGYPFEAFVPVIRQTAVLCKMRFESPFVVHAAHKLSPDALAQEAERYRSRLASLVEESRHA